MPGDGGRRGSSPDDGGRRRSAGAAAARAGAARRRRGRGRDRAREHGRRRRSRPQDREHARGDRVARADGEADRGADGGADRGTDRAPTEAPTEEPTPEATPTAESTPTAEPSGEPDLDRAHSLQVEGYNARRAGDFQTALARSQAALEACGSARELSPCGFALFEQGAALNALGQYDAAIQSLQQRLEVYGDNESGEVAKELKKAERNARKAAGGEG